MRGGSISIKAENVFVDELHGWSEVEIDRAVAEVLRFVGLEGEESKYPEELSGGMKRSLEIARGFSIRVCVHRDGCLQGLYRHSCISHTP